MLINREVITKDSCGIERKYTYKITEEILDGIKEYGIKVVREDSKEGQITNNISKEVKYISSEKERVSEMLNVLSRNEVSPIHLNDIIGEYIDRNQYIE